MKEYDVIALGELLIDFTENGVSSQNNPLFEANPGGAPCNVLAMLASLGKKTAFIGKVGDDIFGHLLKDTLVDVSIDTKGLVIDKKCNTTLAFVHTLKGGEREFSFYRNPGADELLSFDEVDYELIKSSKVFHFGTLSMTNEVAEKATKSAIKFAKENGCLISFDPNLRENLWSDLFIAKEKVEYGLRYTDILKISDNEIVWFTGEQDYDKAVSILQREYKIPLILVSLGNDGSLAYSNGNKAYVPCYKVDCIEKTGAGDTFFGCVLSEVLDRNKLEYSKEELEEILSFANAGAALITTKRGALKVMPSRSEIEQLIHEQSR